MTAQLILIETPKLCRRCRKSKPLSEFVRWHKSKDGRAHWCRSCCSDWRREDMANDPVGRRMKRRRAYLRKVYGISIETFDAILSTQGNSCAICRTELHHDTMRSLKHVCVDHDHVTGAVRGILCRNCNSGIGQLRDDLRVVEAAARYLRERRPPA